MVVCENFYLYVWGPGFGLASIDPECLAAIAYLSAHTPIGTRAWKCIVSSPSAVPSNRLPALHDPMNEKWHTGLDAIAAFAQSYKKEEDSDDNDFDRTYNTSWSSYLASHAAPLISLSLYASHTNWTTATRPAYSRILPFPLTWSEPPRVRDEMLLQVEGLGFEGLDVDAKEEEGSAERKAAAGLLKIPETLLRGKKTVSGALSPEAKALLRLRGEAKEVLDVLCNILPEKDVYGRKSKGPSYGIAEKSIALCRVYAYLALMYKPELPRPWLRDLMRDKYAHLCEYVDRAPEMWTMPIEANLLPRAIVEEQMYGSDYNDYSIAARFARGAMRFAPWGLGEEWFRWIMRKRRQGASEWGIVAASVMGLVCAAAGGSFLVAGAWWYKSRMPFGLPVMRFKSERASRGLRGLGSAGAMLAYQTEDDGVIRTSPSVIGPE